MISLSEESMERAVGNDRRAALYPCRMDACDRAAAEGRQAGRLGRPISDLPHDLGETGRRAWRAGWRLGHEEAQAWHAVWEAGVRAYGRKGQ
jgi:ribosome modulation factor